MGFPWCIVEADDDALGSIVHCFEPSDGIAVQVSVPYYWTTSDGDAIAWFEAVHNATEKVIISFYNTPWESYDAPVAVLQEVAKLERVRVLKWYTDRAPMTFRWAQTITELRDEFAIIDNTLQP